MARKYKARTPIPEPHLIPDGKSQRCSLCGHSFPADVNPSMSVAFAEHLQSAHLPERAATDVDQDAAPNTRKPEP